MLLKNLSKGSNGETDIEYRFMDMARGEERVRCMEKKKTIVKPIHLNIGFIFLNHAYRFISQKIGKQQYGEVLS